MTDLLSAPRYGCWNSPNYKPGASYPVQDGWRYYPDECGEITRMPIIVMQKNVMKPDCGYTRETPDKHCIGCRRATPHDSI